MPDKFLWIISMMGLTLQVVLCLDSYDLNLFFKKTDQPEYSSWLRPHNQKLMNVNASIFLNKFGPMDELKSEFSVSMNLYLSWHDSRLAINNQSDSAIQISQQDLQRIWRPAIHFSNVNAYTADLLANATNGITSTGPYLGVIYGDGRVYVRKRVNLIGVCKLNFMLYPLDIHQCSIQIESSSLPIENLRLEWAETDALIIPDDFAWGNFDLLDYALLQNLIDYPMTGQYSRIEAVFSLQRKSGYFLFNLYLPSTLFVISSWTSFWIEIPAAPARAMLTMTTMLAHITSTKAVHDTLPRVSYIHSLDVWIIMCTLFIFAAVVEYATVNYYYFKQGRANFHLEHHNQKMARKEVEENNNIPEITSDQETDAWAKLTAKNMTTGWNRVLSILLPGYDGQKLSPRCTALRIDRAARIVFPILFITLNFVYWVLLIAFTSTRS